MENDNFNWLEWEKSHFSEVITLMLSQFGICNVKDVYTDLHEAEATCLNTDLLLKGDYHL